MKTNTFTQQSNFPGRSVIGMACMALAIGLQAPSLQAASFTWTGGGGANNSWLNEDNWTGTGVPGAGDLAFFTNDAPNAPIVVDIPSAVSVDRVIISAGGNREVTFEGAGTLQTLVPGNTDNASLAFNTSIPTTFKVDVILPNDFDVRSQGGGHRNFEGSITSVGASGNNDMRTGTLNFFAANDFGNRPLRPRGITLNLFDLDALSGASEILFRENATMGLGAPVVNPATNTQIQSGSNLRLRAVGTSQDDRLFRLRDLTHSGGSGAEINFLSDEVDDYEGSVILEFVGNASGNGSVDTLITTLANSIVRVNNVAGGTLTFLANTAGRIAAVTGDGRVEKHGEGTLLMRATSTYLGGTWIHDGLVQMQAGTQDTGTLPVGGEVHIAEDGGLDINGINQQIGGLRDLGGGGGTVELGAGNLTLDGGIDALFSGSISGSGSVIKVSAETQEFSGNLEVGAVTVNAGTLLLTTANVEADTVDIGVAGSIEAVGAVLDADVSVQGGLAVLDSPLQVGGSLAFLEDSEIVFDLQSGGIFFNGVDQSLTAGTGVTLTFVGTYVVGQNYLIADWTSATGFIFDPDELLNITITNPDIFPAWNFGDDQLFLMVIPEPSAGMLLAALGGALLLARRFRRRQLS